MQLGEKQLELHGLQIMFIGHTSIPLLQVIGVHRNGYGQMLGGVS
jgi:hypothetical protein